MRKTREERIEELRRNPIFRQLVEDLRGQTPEQIARLDRDYLDGELARLEAEYNESEQEEGLGPQKN